MKCPYCSDRDTKVVDSRSFDEGAAIRRRRHCDSCGERFTTFERIDTIPLAVVKRNQTRESFDRLKILNGIIKSCNKRPVTMEQMEKLVDRIEQTALNSMTKEISSSEIGDMVMAQLKEIDRVAYVRFASVYRQFEDIDSFLQELSQLLQDNKT